MAGRVTWGRVCLLRHPSFFAEEEPAHLMSQVMEDPRVVATEQHIFNSLAAQTTPFVASLDEATINVTFSVDADHKNDVFKRVLAHTAGPPTGFGWRDRHMAYACLNKLHLGPERIISTCKEEAEDAELRATRRLQACRLEAAPQLRTRAAGGNTLFEAFSTAVWATPQYHLLLRQVVVEFMRQQPAEYAMFLGNDYEAYLEAMARPGVAGDELMLRAMVDRFGIPCTVVSGDEVIWCVRYPPRQLLSQREVCLAVAPAATFAAVRRQSALTSLKLSLSSPKQRRKLDIACTAGQ